MAGDLQRWSESGSFLAGDAVLPKTPVFAGDTTPVPVDRCSRSRPVEQAMRRRMVRGDWGGSSIGGGIFAVSVRTSANQVLEIPIQIPKDGTISSGMFGARTATATRSIFEIDDLPMTTQPLEYQLGQGFQRDWVSSQSPADPRPFEAAGPHSIYISSRRTTPASIGWR